MLAIVLPEARAPFPAPLNDLVLVIVLTFK
jgi:hypothetical protein